MSIEDRLRAAMGSGPRPAASDEEAWRRITERAAARRGRRRGRWLLVLVPVLGAGGAGLGLSGALAPAAHPSRVAVVPAPPGPTSGSGWGPNWSVGGPTTWLHGGPPNYLAYGPATTLTCSSGREPDCYVVVQSNGMAPSVGGTGSQAPSALYRSTDTGASWTRVSLPAQTWLSSPLSCSGPAVCAAGAVVGGEPGATPGASGQAELLDTSDGGRHWTAHRLPGTVGLVPVLACPTPRHCVALAWGRQGTDVGGIGPESGADRFFETSVLTTTDGGRTWSTSRLPAVTGPTHYQLLSLVCPTDRDCIALGERVRMLDQSGGYVPTDGTFLALSSPDSGRSWRTTASSATTAYHGVACGSASTCLVVGQTLANPLPSAPPSVLLSHTAGRSWATIPAPTGLPGGFGSPPVSVGCPSAQRCVVSDGGGGMATTADGGRLWSQVASLPAAAPGYSQGYITAVSCAGAGPCLALQDLFPAPQSSGRLTAARVLIDSAPG